MGENLHNKRPDFMKNKKRGFNKENSAECMKYFYEIESEYAIFMRILFPFLS